MGKRVNEIPQKRGGEAMEKRERKARGVGARGSRGVPEVSNSKGKELDQEKKLFDIYGRPPPSVEKDGRSQKKKSGKLEPRRQRTKKGNQGHNLLKRGGSHRKGNLCSGGGDATFHFKREKVYGEKEQRRVNGGSSPA